MIETPKPPDEESEYDDDDDDDDRDEEGEEDDGTLCELQEGGGSEPSELQSDVKPYCEEGKKESQLGTLAVSCLVGESDQFAGFQGDSTSELVKGVELKDKVRLSNREITAQTAECLAQNQNQLQSSVCSTSSSELLPSPTLIEQRPSSGKIKIPESKQQHSSEVKAPTLSAPITRTSASDGFNWRKYGQKLVKSPEGSRSYYRCTNTECSAKRIACCDHSGSVIEMVFKGQHNHDPPRKISCRKNHQLALHAVPVVWDSVTENPSRMFNGLDLSIPSEEPVQGMCSAPERKRQNSIASEGNGEIKVKEELFNEPEPKRRVKKGNFVRSSSIVKPGKKPKVVVHAAGDVGISGDGYRWRKYGQKMVKGKPHPRNYYRCTSAGCPVRKHIETSMDNTNAVIITYKGIHDHDTPVPKKRHGAPSAPLVAASSPASMNNQNKEAFQTHISSTQWSLDTHGELTGKALDLGGEKVIESARTLLSIGFEIKPC